MTTMSVLLGLVMATGPIGPAQAGSGQAGPQQNSQLSDAVFKNVKVLKGIPVDEFIPIVSMNSSTGMPLSTLTFLKTASESWEFCWGPACPDPACAGPIGPVAITRPSSTLIVVMFGKFLLGKPGLLGPACNKQRFVRSLGFGDSRQGSPRFYNLTAVSFKNHFLSRQEIFWAPALSSHRVWTGQFKVPISDVTFRIGDIDVHAHVRIQPLDFGDDAGQFDLLVRVIFGIESMVCEGGNRKTEKRNTGDKNAALRFHCNTS